MNKQLLFTLFMLAGLIRIEAQLTTTRPLPSGVKTTVATSTPAVAGNWTGTQTNDYGQYPQAVSFELTVNGEFIMGSAARGTYTIINNTINGTFKQFSNNETFAFSGIFDPATNKITCTLGMGTTIKGQGRWVVSKQTSTTLKTTTIQNTTINNTRIVQSTTQPTANNTTSTTTTKNPPNKYFRCDRTNYDEYYLINAKAIIYTGNDSKEGPSSVFIDIYIPGEASIYGGKTPSMIGSTVGEQSPFKYEFKVNSNVTLPIGIMYFPCGNGKVADYIPYEASLTAITQSGLIVNIGYVPNFFMDAWKVERVDLVLEFKQPDGTLHNVYGNKIIPFNNLNKLLTSSDGKLTLKIDGFLMPLNK